MRLNPLRLFLVILALVVASAARAQDPTSVTTVIITPPPPANPFTFDLGTSWGLSLHLNASVAGYGYDFTHKASIGQINVGGLYVLTSTKLHDAGLGLGGTVALGTGSNSTGTGVAGTFDGAIVSPKLDRYRIAAIMRRSFGPVAAWIGVLAPTAEF